MLDLRREASLLLRQWHTLDVVLGPQNLRAWYGHLSYLIQLLTLQNRRLRPKKAENKPMAQLGLRPKPPDPHLHGLPQHAPSPTQQGGLL